MKVPSIFWVFCATSLLFLLVSPSFAAADTAADDEFEDEDGVVTDVQDDDSPKKQYAPPLFQTPTIDTKKAHFVDWFDDLTAIGKRWMKSTAKKEGAEEAIAKYDGQWEINPPNKVVIEKDYGLIVSTKARHHAIAATLRKPFVFDGQPLIVQYEVKYEEGQECGGGYIKLLSVDGGNAKMEAFHDKTPYTIMFGPDKCGITSKVHFILKLKNPKSGEISEHHAKQPSKSLNSYFDDKKTHLYTLIVKPDNSYQVLVDNTEIMAGNMLTDLEPSVTPPKQIADPEDKKPADWDERETIEDVEAKKPDDWDESEPKEIVDEDAQKPSDWLDDEEALIPDEQATKPKDWDDDMDGEWEPKKIANPKCDGVSGCGKWTKPMKPNPNYKGKWTAPKIPNPAYKGKWSPRLIDNPHYFEADPYKQLASVAAIGFELWTMSSGIMFDNIILTDDIDLAREFARQTYNVKVDQERILESVTTPSQMQTIWTNLKEVTEERPWLWAVFVLALLIPIIIISVFCFGKKSPSASSHAKKTDDVQEDDDVEDEGAVEEDEQPSTSTAKETSPAKRQSLSKQDSQQESSENSQAAEETVQPESADAEKQPSAPSSPSAVPRSRRVRRAD